MASVSAATHRVSRTVGVRRRWDGDNAGHVECGDGRCARIMLSRWDDALDTHPGILRQTSRDRGCGPDMWSRASCASAAQHTMTILARSTWSASFMVKPAIAISRPSIPPARPTAMRINTSGSETSGARSAEGRQKVVWQCPTMVRPSRSGRGHSAAGRHEDQDDERHDHQPGDAAAVRVLVSLIGQPVLPYIANDRAEGQNDEHCRRCDEPRQ